MKFNKALSISLIIILLLFSLTTTGCTTSKRPDPENNNSPVQNEETLNNSQNASQSRAENDAVVNDKRTKDNIMPDQPAPATPTPETAFTLDQIREFELDVKLTNNDFFDMKYVKGPFNSESRVETKLHGKTEVIQHEEASRSIEKLIRQIPGASLSDSSKIIDATLSALKIKRDEVSEFSMEFKFESGERVEIEFNK